MVLVQHFGPNWTKILVLKNPRKPRKSWCQLSDLNQRPTDYKSDALPAELNWQCALLYLVRLIISSLKIHKMLALLK